MTPQPSRRHLRFWLSPTRTIVTPDYALPYTLRLSKAIYWVAGLLCAAPLMLMLFLVAGSPQWREGLALGVLVSGFFTVVVLSASGGSDLTLHEERLVYRVRGRENVVRYADITLIQAEWFFSGGRYSTSYLVLLLSQRQIEKSTSSVPVEIHLGPYLRQDLAVLFDVLTHHAPQATLNTQAARMAAGTYRISEGS